MKINRLLFHFKCPKFDLLVLQLVVGFSLMRPQCLFAYDNWDYAASLGARTHNFGGRANLSVNYNYQLWQGQIQNQSVYGYIRPRLELTSSLVVNSVQAEVQVFPISFFGITLGHSRRYRDWQLTGFDCIAVSCSGQIMRDYVAGHLFYKYKTIFMVGMIEVQNLNYDRADLPYADSKYMMRFGPGSDRLLISRAFIGYELSSKLTAGYLTEWGEADSGDRMESHYLLGRWKLPAPWILSIGVGSRRTSILPAGFDLFSDLSWSYGEKLGYL